MIEDGKITRPIKDVNIIGNGPKVLELVDMVSDDLAIDEGGWTCGKNGQRGARLPGAPDRSGSPRSPSAGGRARGTPWASRA